MGRSAKNGTRRRDGSATESARLRVAVLGGGAWATALAIAAARSGNRVRQWMRDARVATHMEAWRTHPKVLTDVALPESLSASAQLPWVAHEAEVVLIAVPSQAVRSVATQLRPHLPRGATVIACSKGVETSTGLLMTEVLDDVLHTGMLGVLSGPNFAGELARNKPTWTTLALEGASLSATTSARMNAHTLAHALSSRRFRVCLSDDLVGAQVGGAVKNVVAIACGMAEGLEAGQNAHAGIVTLGLGEMTRLAVAKGARESTMLGMSGNGDLQLTCSNATSRNYSFGLALATTYRAGTGEGPLVEGAINALSVCKLAERMGVPMPVCQAVRKAVEGACTPAAALDEVLAAPLSYEAPSQHTVSVEPHDMWMPLLDRQVERDLSSLHERMLRVVPSLGYSDLPQAAE